MLGALIKCKLFEVFIDERERLESLCGAERLFEAQQSLQEALAQNETWQNCRISEPTVELVGLLPCDGM